MKYKIEETQQSEKKGVVTHVTQGPMAEMAAHQSMQLIFVDAASIILKHLG